MIKSDIGWLFLLLLLFPSPALSQATVEFGGSQASLIGVGAGLAASLNHGKTVKRSYESIVKAQQAAAAQTKAIEQYMRLGYELETKKRWQDAETSFKYVLRVIARRDGPGSKSSVPTLEHLVSVTEAQDKLNDAIGYQKTVLAFKKAAAKPDPSVIVKAENYLSDLFIKKGDYISAEPLLRESVATCVSQSPVIPSGERHRTAVTYVRVLRKLDKNSEAETLEATNQLDLPEDKITKDADLDSNLIAPETIVVPDTVAAPNLIKKSAEH